MNRHETKEAMLGKDVLQIAGYDISLFDNCLYFRPYESLGAYHKAQIPFPQGDKALRAAGGRIVVAKAAMLYRSTEVIRSTTSVASQSTIDSFTERAADAAARCWHCIRARSR